jgi:YVTN family beta-propeller protein
LLLATPAMAADAYLGFVSHTGANTVTVFDPNSNAVITTFSTDSSPRSLVVNPGGSYVYVACLFSKTVDVYRTGDYVKTATITMPTGPYSLGTNADGDKLYVADTTTKIYVINIATNTIEKTLTSTATGYGQMYLYNDKMYIVKNTDGKVVVLDTITDTISTYITVGTLPAGIVGNPTVGKIYVANQGATTVSVINPATDTVTATIDVGANGPIYPSINSEGTRLYVPCYASDVLKIIDTSSNTVIASVNTADQPMGSAVEPNNQYIYVANYVSNNISVISRATTSVVSSINLSYSTPDYMGIWKIAGEISSSTPTQTTFTITSGVLKVTEANVSVYDAYTGEFISSDNTDDAGNVIFWLIPGKRYTVTVTGTDIVSSSQSVQVQPNRDLYTINVQTTEQWWNPFKWFNSNGTSTNGSVDVTKSITSGYTHTLIGTTGYIDVLYNDTTGQTTSVNFSLYYRNTTSGKYEFISNKVVAANNASNNFSILNAAGNSYRFYANGTNLLFSNDPIPRVGEYSFPSAPFNLGWPESWYMYFEIMVFLIIGYMSTRRKAVMLAGSTFMLFISWVFLLIGWLNSFSLLVPIMISVFAILVFAYAIAKWRMESGI